METELIRERLQEYIRFAEDKKIQAIYTMVESEIQEDLDLWEDEGFLKEMNARPLLVLSPTSQGSSK